MPVTIRDVLGSRSEPKIVHPDNSLAEALNMMQRFDYSAVPVIDDEQNIVGILTVEGILKALRSLGLLLDELTIRAAMDHKPRTLQLDEELPEVLRLLNDQPCVLITDANGKLIDIVTPWDTSEYYRQRSEDLMYIRDVEAALKEHIYSAFADADGVLDQSKLSEAIAVIASAFPVSLTREMLHKYFKGDQNVPKAPDRDVLTALEEELKAKVSNKSLDDLSMDQLITLLFFDETWSVYSPTIKIPEDSIKDLLERIRKMRNDLAHFRRDELTGDEREDLRSCIRLLQDSYPPTGWSLSSDESETLNTSEEVVILVDDEEDPVQGKYTRLGTYLRELPMRTTELKHTFSEIEEILEVDLPASARKHRSWWANDGISHTHSKEWLDAGWRVASLNMTEERVKLVRNKEREAAYIKFFSELLNDLRQVADFEVYDVSPAGTSYTTAKALPPNERKRVWLNFSFTRKKQLRVELYIDSGNGDLNKQIFDILHEQKKNIETDFGNKLNWERLDSRYASRISSYHDGFITDSDEELEALRKWATDAMIRLEKAFSDRTEQAIADVL